jgi:hypothetical protein
LFDAELLPPSEELPIATKNGNETPFKIAQGVIRGRIAGHSPALFYSMSLRATHAMQNP